jgi:nitric oxide reductase NorQ protein
MAARLVRAGLPLEAACRAAIVDALTDDAETAAALTELTAAVIDG